MGDEADNEQSKPTPVEGAEGSGALVEEFPNSAAESVDDSGTSAVYVVTVETPSGETIPLHTLGPNEIPFSIKQHLQGYYETCGYSAYRFVRKLDNGSTADLNDLEELGVSIPSAETGAVNVELKMVLESYDAVRIRHHIKHTREIIMNPPLKRGSKGPESEEDRTESAPQGADSIGSAWKQLNSSSSLGSYFQETLFGYATNWEESVQQSKAAKCLKGIHYSGWNPAPPQRRMLGEIAYIEVDTAAEGAFFLTATQEGFFVNRSTKGQFDPRPVPDNACFSHELLSTILCASASIRSYWNERTSLKNALPESAVTRLAVELALGRPEAVFVNQATHWTSLQTLPNGKSIGRLDADGRPIDGGLTHDIGRAMEDYSNPVSGDVATKVSPSKDWYAV